MKKNNAPLFQGFVLGKGAVKEQVYQILRDHILEGRLPPGTKNAVNQGVVRNDVNFTKFSDRRL
ncbi:Transcriptional regulator, GntR family domain / Aspartate aminotransferase [Citrobacter freundii]|uniref:Transcriptional regulator, GntR family domain / Aspartate aminotransferase n=1 Tax=Citrobacter freundii TaxID=546 RepID=A0A7G2IX32_CITFR|nr:Transcriptional regulator, GntR family domain / Aspartate aminotransferase [Citrobacter freundii]